MTTSKVGSPTHIKVTSIQLAEVIVDLVERVFGHSWAGVDTEVALCSVISRRLQLSRVETNTRAVAEPPVFAINRL